MKHIVSIPNLVHEISDAKVLSEMVPQHMGPIMEEIDREKKMDKEIGYLGKFRKTTGWWGKGTMQRVAKVPGPLLGMLVQIDPDFMRDKRKFYKWLSEHKDYDMRQKVEVQ